MRACACEVDAVEDPSTPRLPKQQRLLVAKGHSVGSLWFAELVSRRRRSMFIFEANNKLDPDGIVTLLINGTCALPADRPDSACMHCTLLNACDVWGVSLAADEQPIREVVKRLDYLYAAGGNTHRALPQIQLVVHDRTNVVKHALAGILGHVGLHSYRERRRHNLSRASSSVPQPRQAPMPFSWHRFNQSGVLDTREFAIRLAETANRFAHRAVRTREAVAQLAADYGWPSAKHLAYERLSLRPETELASLLDAGAITWAQARTWAATLRPVPKLHVEREQVKSHSDDLKASWPQGVYEGGDSPHRRPAPPEERGEEEEGCPAE